MHTIIRVLKTIFLPHLASDAENKFNKENSQHWEPSIGTPGVLIETALSTPASLTEKFLIAKLIEKKTGMSSIVLLNSIYRQASSAYGVASSFGMSNFICWWRGYFNLLLVFRCIASTLILIRSTSHGEALLALKINGVHIGDLVYDTLIRYRPNCYTVRELRFREHFRLIFRAIYNFHRASKIFERYNIKAVVTSHSVYAEFGILCRIAHAKGAVVFLKDMDVFRVYEQKSNIYEHFLRINPDELSGGLHNPEVVKTADEYFDRRLGGKIDQVDLKNAYTNKRMYDKSELLRLVGVNEEKKCVFVMAHAFSDAPHVGGKLAFADYYVWLRETLRALSENNKVNVFVKPHPSSYMWGERGAVETLLDEIGVKNVYVTPKDLNTLSIRKIADYVVTARGTAGLEYSGFGIPALTCGEGYYSGFGVAIEANSSASYIKLLTEITELEPLDAVVSRKARVLLYLTFTKLSRSSIAPSRHIYPGDNAEILIPQHFEEMTFKLRERGSYQDEFYATVTEAISRAF